MVPARLAAAWSDLRKCWGVFGARSPPTTLNQFAAVHDARVVQHHAGQPAEQRVAGNRGDDIRSGTGSVSRLGGSDVSSWLSRC
jgi:hypothetical protein